MRRQRHLAVLLILALLLSFSANAQKNIAYGICVTVRSSGNASTGHRNFGKIQRYDIRNNQPSFVKDIYTGTNARCANISPDGTRCAFLRSDNKICIINIDGSGAVRVLDNIKDAGDGWIDWPMDQWIYFSPDFANAGLKRINVADGRVEDLGSFGGGSTWTISVSQDGTRGCISANWNGWTSWTFTISNGRVGKVKHVGACGGSISPDGSLYTLNHGNHTDISVKRFGDHSLYQKWSTSRNSGAGSNWNRHRWSSNSKDWVTITQGTPYQMEMYFNQVLYYVPDRGATNIKVTNNNGSGYNEGDDLWIQHSTRPVLGFSPSSLSFEAELGGANPSARTVRVANTGAGSLPALSASADASWLNVSVSGTQITNQVNLDGVESGVHVATVTVSGSGVDSKSYTVQLKVVAPPVLSSISVDDARVEPGKTVQLSAIALDQYDAPLNPQPAIAWSIASGGGTVSSSGIYSAPDSEGSTTVKAAATHDGKSGEATATVMIAVPPPVNLRINSGGGSVGEWEAGASYLTTSPEHPAFEFPGTHDVTGVKDPAPNGVYQTAALDETENAFEFGPDIVPAGSYTVRFHFTLGEGHTSTFLMDYSIEGEQVLNDFNIVEAAGGYNKAVVKEFTTKVNGDGLQIVGTRVQGPTVFLAGIEVIGGGGSSSLEPVTVSAPNGGETFEVGGTMRATWTGDPSKVTGVMVKLSVDGGKSWHTISGDQSRPAFNEGGTTGSFEWRIAPEAGGQAVPSNSCRIKVVDYMVTSLADQSDADFAIVGPGSVGTRRPLSSAHNRVQLRTTSDGLRILGIGEGQRVELFDLRGCRIAPAARTAGTAHVRAARGVYLLRGTADQRTGTMSAIVK